MAASIKRIIRKALPEIIQSKDATTGERLEACRLLLKILASATKGKPRGRAFTRKVNGEAKNPQESLALTYDALGKMVEQNRSGAYTQFLYSPTGFKMSIMNGQSTQKSFVPLPGGAMAVYTSSGLTYYGHSDHLGSLRFASTPSRTMYFDLAHAPFGEIYASSGSTDPAFTSQRQDTVSGLYDFPAREYSIQGRWPSPDPAGVAAVDPSNPQSWNRYAYVLNDPTDYVDPLGLILYNGTINSDVFLLGVDVGHFCPLHLFDGGCIIGGRHLWDDVGTGPDRNSGNSGGQSPCLAGAGPLAPGQSRCGNTSGSPCANVPNSPPAASATFNANLVSLEAQGMWPATKLDFFYQVFRTGGTFDYKATTGDNQYVNYGNWNFGYVCAASYPALFCQSAAGMNRMYRAATHGRNPFGSGIPFVKPPYGDQAADNQQIRNGIQAYQSGCVQ